MTAAIGWTDLACLRGARILFEGLSHRLGPGEALLVTGPNGVGKSSLLRVLAGLLPAAAGRIDRGATLALVDERPALDPHLSLHDAIGWWAALDGAPAPATAAALAAMGLTDIAEVPVRMLSTGQRRRAALARAIAGGAAVWLLDEPGNGLDAASLDRLATAMAVHRSAGGIVIAASHQPLGLDDAAALALA